MIAEGFSPRAVLLDFYGTVVEEDDAEVALVCAKIAEASPMPVAPAEISSQRARAFRRLADESHGSAFRSEREVERISLQRVVQHFQADLDVDPLLEIAFENWARPGIFPESREVLDQCRVPICLVSNVDNAALRSALRHNDLRFDYVVTSEDYRAYKPRREMFDKALSLLELSAGEVLHVGDSLSSDVRGAKAQGIRVLWVNRNRRPLPLGDEAPDYTSTDLTGLLDILSVVD